MRLHHILGAAIFCGAMGTLGGQTAQAQAPSSARFVQLLLRNENILIRTDTKTLNTRDQDIAKLNAATSSRKIRQLSAALSPQPPDRQHDDEAPGYLRSGAQRRRQPDAAGPGAC